MSAGEYLGWERHLRYWPPGDTLTQRLLAELCALVANAGFELKQPAKAEHFAPWLETPEQRAANAERRAAEREQRQKAGLIERALMVERAYRNSRHGR